jgi:cytochrome c oxidase subunit 2
MIKNFVKSFSSLNLFILPVVNANDWQFGFQPPATSIMEGIISFHDDLMVFLTFILVSVMYVMTVCIFFFARTKKNNTSIRFNHASTLEVVWTIIPALILIIIAIPSFSLLYSMDEIIEPIFTIKCLGHQWYWSYELLESESLQALLNPFITENNGATKFVTSAGEAFDSYMIPEDELYSRDDLLSQIRLLTVDNHLFIPTEMPTRILVSSADVLHSWAVPSLGVKIDACPGRLNQTSLFIKHEGIYYGQCSEICGVNHGFMPIGIYSSDVTFTHPIFILSRELISSTDPIIAGLGTLLNE